MFYPYLFRKTTTSEKNPIHGWTDSYAGDALYSIKAHHQWQMQRPCANPTAQRGCSNKLVQKSKSEGKTIAKTSRQMKCNRRRKIKPYHRNPLNICRHALPPILLFVFCISLLTDTRVFGIRFKSAIQVFIFWNFVSDFWLVSYLGKRATILLGLLNKYFYKA